MGVLTPREGAIVVSALVISGAILVVPPDAFTPLLSFFGADTSCPLVGLFIHVFIARTEDAFSHVSVARPLCKHRGTAAATAAAPPPRQVSPFIPPRHRHP